MSDIDIEIIMECTRHKDGIRYTALVNYLEKKTGLGIRKIKQKIAEHDGVTIIRRSIKGYGYPVYFINSRDFGHSHRLYMLGTKFKSFFAQHDVSDIIKRNEDHFELDIKNKEDGIYTDSATVLLASLYWHQKLTFAIYSGFFADSKSELALAKINKQRIEKLISKIYINASKTDYDLWHDLIHGVHDVLELNRNFSKEQLSKIYSI